MSMPKPGKSEQREQDRKRTRLRSGKLVTLDGLFLTECHFQDLAEGGARIRIIGHCDVPDRFWLFDDQYCGALITRIVWRKDLDLGVQFSPDSSITPLSERVLHALSGKYYSLAK